MITLSQAQALLTQALSDAQKHQQAIAAAVTDSHGELIGFARMDDVSLHAAVLAQNKAYTSARDRQRSGDLGKWARETGKDMGYWTDAKITGIAGGAPISIDGKVVGALGVSGLSEEEDESLAVRSIDAIFG